MLHFATTQPKLRIREVRRAQLVPEQFFFEKKKFCQILTKNDEQLFFLNKFENFR